MKPRQAVQKEFSIVGIETRTTNQAEMEQSTARIPGLWGKFFSENLHEKIPNRVDPKIFYGVYTRYESDLSGAYSLIVGNEVSHAGNIPEGMVAHSIPAGNYLVFEGSGALPDVVMETWGKVWSYFSENKTEPRAYTTDFERYEFFPDGKAGVQIHVAVGGKS